MSVPIRGKVVEMYASRKATEVLSLCQSHEKRIVFAADAFSEKLLPGTLCS